MTWKITDWSISGQNITYLKFFTYLFYHHNKQKKKKTQCDLYIVIEVITLLYLGEKNCFKSRDIVSKLSDQNNVTQGGDKTVACCLISIQK